MRIQTTVELTDDRVCGLLCTAFEGGVGYWCMIMDYMFAPGVVREDFAKGGKLRNEDWPNLYLAVPMLKGFAVVCREMDDGYTCDSKGQPTGKDHLLTREKIEAGLQLMADKYPRHFADFIADNDDAITGDVFLQCCLLGEVVYG
jgi:hypothetical protein